MPEGHTLHRLAHALEELFGGHRLTITSPQGRFSAPAARISGSTLLTAQAVGKHLLIALGEPAISPREAREALAAGDLPPDMSVLHIHLGLYGSWTFDGDATFTAPHAIGAPRRRINDRGETALPRGAGGAAPSEAQAWQAPEPVGAVRVRLRSEHGVADLTGPATCELLDSPGVQRLRKRLGPDPLDDAADPQTFIDTVRRRNRAIAGLLMDQSVIAGVGNIYRAEGLFRHGLAPDTPGRRVSEAQLRDLWEDLRVLMRDGVRTGRITTVDEADIPQPLPEGDEQAGRWYVYHRSGRPCLRCGTSVAMAEWEKRKLYWCPGCQGGQLSASR